MFKKIIILILAFFSLPVIAQTTSVTATVTDSDGFTWNNATAHIIFAPNPNIPNLNLYTINGVPITSVSGPNYNQYLNQTVQLNTSGQLSITLLDNQQITPSGSSWTFVIQSDSSAPATSYKPVSVSGASQSLTSYLSTNAIAPRFPAIGVAFGYGDVEVTYVANPGGFYYNTTTLNQRVWNGTSWTNQGSGVVGPGSSINADIATYNGTTGSLLQDSGWNLTSSTLTSPASQNMYFVTANGGYNIYLEPTGFTNAQGNGLRVVPTSGNQSASNQPWLLVGDAGGYNKSNTGGAGTTQQWVKFTPIINQTSTAAETDLLINRTETTLGSGAQLFADMQVAGVSKFNIDHLGNVTSLGDFNGYGSTFNQVANVTAPTGTPSTTGGTITASTTNFAIIGCIDSGGNTTWPTNKSSNVTTTGSTSSIAWTWTAVTGCVSYNVWVANTGTASHYFTSSTNSYTQTLPATSGTSGTLPVGSYSGAIFAGGQTAPNGLINLPGVNGLTSANGICFGVNCIYGSTSGVIFTSNVSLANNIYTNGGANQPFTWSTSAWNTSSGLATPFSITSTDLISGGSYNQFQLTPTHNQSGTAGTNDFVINRTETTLGSGAQNFMDFQVAGASKFHIDHTGSVTASAYNITNAQCLAQAVPISTPCVAISSGPVTGLTASSTTGTTYTLYTSNAPAGAAFEACPNIYQDTGTGSVAGSGNLNVAWTTPGGNTNSGYTLSAVSFASGGFQVGLANCINFTVASNTSASATIVAAGATGTITWEYNLIITRIR